jgi:predicted methyltransferase
VRPEERVLSLLTQTTDPWEVAGRCRLPFARLAELLRDLEARGLVRSAPGRVTLTAAGRRQAVPLPDLTGPRLGAVGAAYRRLIRGRPPATDRFDQGHLTVESVLARVRDMARFGDLYPGVRVAVLGDDDLASLALALTGLPARVTVFEIDEQLTAFIAEAAGRRGLPVEVHTADLRRPLPRGHLGAYDAFLCDPSETEAGLRMFVGRGLSCLRPGPGAAGYFGVTLIEADLAKWRALQRWVSGFPVAVSAVIPEHGWYENWPTQAEEARAWGVRAFERPARRPWYRSALYRLETLEGFEPPRLGPIGGDPIVDEQYFGARSGRR